MADQWTGAVMDHCRWCDEEKKEEQRETKKRRGKNRASRHSQFLLESLKGSSLMKLTAGW